MWLYRYTTDIHCHKIWKWYHVVRWMPPETVVVACVAVAGAHLPPAPSRLSAPPPAVTVIYPVGAGPVSFGLEAPYGSSYSQPVWPFSQGMESLHGNLLPTPFAPVDSSLAGGTFPPIDTSPLPHGEQVPIPELVIPPLPIGPGPSLFSVETPPTGLIPEPSSLLLLSGLTLLRFASGILVQVARIRCLCFNLSLINRRQKELSHV